MLRAPHCRQRILKVGVICLSSELTRVSISPVVNQVARVYLSGGRRKPAVVRDAINLDEFHAVFRRRRNLAQRRHWAAVHHAEFFVQLPHRAGILVFMRIDRYPTVPDSAPCAASVLQEQAACIVEYQGFRQK